MKVDTVNYQKIGEQMHIYEHGSGLKAFVIPKKGYSKIHATFATHYGSINNEFIVPGEDKATSVPDGIAHFLEHKLFEQKDGSVMDKFSELGSSPNAYTSFNQTVYLFTCTDRFDDNFRLLLDYVQNPYITEESVEKEKGIIGQEIRMYDDNANWRVFFNLLKALYRNNPVRIDIAGTIESISAINRDILYKCYNTFYHPSNMVILVVGDVDPESVFVQVEDGLRQAQSKPDIKRIFPEEPDGVNKNAVEQKLAVSIPIFQMGYKDKKLNTTGIDSLRREVGIKLLLELIMGKSSELYNRLYNEGLINPTFESDYTLEENYAFSMFGGESPNPDKVRDIIADAISLLKRDGLDKNSYERIRKAMYGRFTKQFNSIERIAHQFISVYFKNVNIFDYIEVYDKISFEYINTILEEHFNPDNMALSVIRPV